MNQTTQTRDSETPELSRGQMRNMAGVTGTIALGFGWVLLYPPSRVAVYGLITRTYTAIMGLLNLQAPPARRDMIYDALYPAYDTGAMLIGVVFIILAGSLFAVIVLDRYAPNQSIVR